MNNVQVSSSQLDPSLMAFTTHSTDEPNSYVFLPHCYWSYYGILYHYKGTQLAFRRPSESRDVKLAKIYYLAEVS